MANRCVFLDRDGVICEEVNYMHNPSQFRLLPKTGDALRNLKKVNYMLVVVSNQSGVALGYFTEKDIQKVNCRMVDELGRCGVSLDGVYYCPHHPEGQGIYRKACDCRKPKPGMLKLAASELNIDLESSYMIGDKTSDIMAGLNAGCKTILVLTGYGKEELTRLRVEDYLEPDFIADDLLEASKIILEKGERHGLDEKTTGNP